MIFGPIREAAALVLSCVLGALILRRFFGLGRWNYVVFGLAPGFGFGVSSLIWFPCFCLFTRHAAALSFALEVLFCAVLVRPAKWKKPALGAWSGTVVVVCVLSAVCALVYFLRLSVAGPYGSWDAWAIWNLHARAIYQSGERAWSAVLPQIGFTHADYPLLLPLNVARLWVAGGAEDTVAPRMLALVYTFATAILLQASVSVLKGRIAGCFAFLIVLASRSYLFAGASQYADVPAGFYFLAAVCSFALFCQKGSRRLLVLSGVCSGLGAWTKNEGLLFAACWGGYVVLAMTRGGGWRRTGYFFLGLLMPVAALATFKVQAHTTSDVLGWLISAEGWARLRDPHRALATLTGFARVLWGLDHWVTSSSLTLAIYVVLSGLEERRNLRRLGWGVLASVAALVAGYVVVVITCPHDVQDFINAAVDRLYIQLWPAAVFAVMLVARVPRLDWFHREPRTSSALLNWRYSGTSKFSDKRL